ncbi:TolC family protein [Myroides pelagicus]|uniref:TolC family protein n=1 Tax=Myroides pelagicus TaxID=270914 RepID=UPI002DBB5847|nr:TolC family protein [Myroides pelagicus]MEC4114908.1 TolC family protein [Myroides pelagicus]
MNIKRWSLLVFCISVSMSYAQKLTMGQALEYAAQNFSLVKVKEANLKSVQHLVTASKQEYFPDLTFGAQQTYGTINAQHGPLYAYGGLGSAATSMPMAEQSWNAAFGALYFANVNWTIFSFGKARASVELAKQKAAVRLEDLNQEIFQLKIKVGAAYLNLLAAQRIEYIQEKNLSRAKVFYSATTAKSQAGLVAQADQQQAQAEVAYAEALYLKASDKVLFYQKQLAVFLEEKTKEYILDDVFVLQPPLVLQEKQIDVESHPMIVYQQRKIRQAAEEEKLVSRASLPMINAFGVIQGRGSGFDWNYTSDPTAFSRSYSKGVGIDRTNYLIGLSFKWNVTDFVSSLSRQKAITAQVNSLTHQYDGMVNELENKRQLTADQFIHAQRVKQQSEIALKATKQVYDQYKALYDNGLKDVVDFTQALYGLHKAEIDHEIAQNNVWQALLYQAAAKGDIDYFLNAIPKT